MINFKKAYQFKIISVLLSIVFLFHSTVYGIDISKKPLLRPRFLCNPSVSLEGNERAARTLEAICKMHPVRIRLNKLFCEARIWVYGKLPGEFFAEKKTRRHYPIHDYGSRCYET